MADETVADGENPLLIDDISQADPNKYHPSDVLLYKWYTAKQIADSPNRSALYASAAMRETSGEVPPRVPWPLPFPRPREQLEIGVEEWRESSLRIIDQRIALYDSKSSGKRSPLAASPAKSENQNGLPHRALGIKELLEQILRYATPSTQYAAWNVSKGWREMVRYILQTQFRIPYPCGPVEYGDAIQPDLNWLQPSDSEIAKFQEVVDQLLENSYCGLFPDSFFTARLSHADKLPQSTFDEFAAFCECVLPVESTAAPLSRDDGPCWMDLSQFEVNPHFTDRFGDSLQPMDGGYALTITPHLQRHLRDQALMPELNELVHTMFLTNPPCKGLGIYTFGPETRFRDLELIERIHNVDGIRIGDLLPRIQQHLSVAIERWRYRAVSMREVIAEESWTRMSSDSEKLSKWTEPGLPQLLFFLESADHNEFDPTFAQALFQTRDSWIEREAQWKRPI
ncbi:hypothetical protein J4E81_006047 [Alternaria sp. BMP 2799]|nr:hypothetical protein J4E81_006047 [Alternaria sp. BMP 2799]